jgi:hypothetical protein
MIGVDVFRATGMGFLGTSENYNKASASLISRSLAARMVRMFNVLEGAPHKGKKES